MPMRRIDTAGEPAIRISVCSWATMAEDVNRSAAAFVNRRTLVQPA